MLFVRLFVAGSFAGATLGNLLLGFVGGYVVRLLETLAPFRCWKPGLVPITIAGGCVAKGASDGSALGCAL